MKNITIYTIDNCGYCEAAKALAKRHNLNVHEVNITKDNEARHELLKRTNHRTMPQIFIEDKFIGGYTELKAHLEKGRS